jgi:DNA-binding IclR family transcriptional regulator
MPSSTRRQCRTTDVAANLGLPTTTTRRILEDLAAHGLISRHPQGQGKADRWKRTTWAAEEETEEEAD